MSNACRIVHEQSYTVFAHLYDGNMRLITQQDNLPVLGTFPTYRWPVGEVIVDRYALPIPPDAPVASYRLGVGMYLLGTGLRARVRRGDVYNPDSIAWLQEVQVAP